MTSSYKEGWTLACCTSERHQSAVTWTAQQTASGGDSNVCHPLCGQRSCSVCPCLWRIRPAILHVWAHSLQIARALHSCRLLSERTTEWYMFCFIFFPPKLFVMPFLSNLFPYDNQMSETWSLWYNQSQRTCHYPYCKPTYSLNVKEIADDNVVWLETPAWVVCWWGGFGYWLMKSTEFAHYAVSQSVSENG